MTSNQHAILRNLAEALFPLEIWIAQKSYSPESQGEPAPWRHGEPLTVQKLGALEFLDALLQETSGDEELAARWVEISSDPLKYCPIRQPQSWRAVHGLNAQAKLGIASSDNAPFGRGTLYGTALPLLEQAVAAANPQTPADWAALADELYKDKPGHWPGGGLASSTFMKQFTCDLLYAMLGMRNAIPAPWQTALLSELGEHRSVGNAHTPGDVKKAREALKKLIV